jgi:hypothetical protein
MKRNVQILGIMLGSAGAIGLYFASSLYIAPASLVVLSSGLFFIGSLMVIAASKKAQDGR